MPVFRLTNFPFQRLLIVGLWWFVSLSRDVVSLSFASKVLRQVPRQRPKAETQTDQPNERLILFQELYPFRRFAVKSCRWRAKSPKKTPTADNSEAKDSS